MRLRADWRSALALLLGLVQPGGALAAGIDRIESDYLRASQLAEKHSGDVSMDGSTEGRRALERSWSLLAEWTAAYLNEHPTASASRLKNAAPMQSGFDVLLIAPRTYLVSATSAGMGTVFIVSGTDGDYRPAWSIRERAGREAFPLLDAWTAKAAADDCRKTVGDADWLHCGPIGGTAMRLPDDAQGHPRFYVEADYSEAAGNTEAEQLSFWIWTGTTAEPQFVTTFGTNIDDEPTRFKDGMLTVRLAEAYRMISPWWDHLDRELDWVFRVGPDRIEDLGKKPLVPEVDLVDELLFRSAHNLSADELATQEVQAKVKAIVAKARDDDAPDGVDGDAFLGMDGSPIVNHRNGSSIVCLPTDEQGNITFTLSGSFVSDISVTPDESGNGCPHDKP